LCNIAPAVHAFFAVVPGLNEDIIITPSVYQLLQDVAKYDVLAPSADNAAGTNAVMCYLLLMKAMTVELCHVIVICMF
jgi:hypothetical protein